MQADLNTTRYLESYLQGENPDQGAQTVMQAFRQDVLATTSALADQQTAFEENVDGVIDEMATSGSLKAQEQRLKELQQQAALLKSFQQEQLHSIAEKNAQLKTQIEQLAQDQVALQQLSAHAAMLRPSPYANTIPVIQKALTAYLRDHHDSH